MTLNSGKKEAIKFTFLMSLSAILVKLLGLPNSIIQAKYLGPSLLGIYAIINVIIQYASYAHMGLLQSLSRDVPIAYGRGDNEEARRISSIIYTGLFFTTFISTGAIWILFALGYDFKGALTFETAILITLIIIVNRSNSFFRSYVKAEGKFIVMGKSELLQQCLTPILSIVLVLLFQLKGVLLAVFFSQLLTVFYYIYNLGNPKFTFIFDWNRTKQLLKTGFLIFFNGTLDSIFWSIDLVILAWLVTTHDVGIYSYALIAMNLVLPIAGAINNVIYRQMMVHGGQHGTQPGSHFRHYLEEPFVCYLALISMLLGIGLLAYMAMVNTILTEYRESLPVMIVLSLGYMIYLSRYFLTFYLNVTNQLTKRFGIILFALGLKALTAFFFLKLDYGLLGVGISGTLSFILVSYSIIWITFKQIYNDKRHGFIFIVKSTGLAILMTLLLTSFYHFNFLDYTTQDRLHWKITLAIGDMFIKAIIYMILCAGSYFIFFKNLKLVGEIKPIIEYVLKNLSHRFRPNVKVNFKNES